MGTKKISALPAKAANLQATDRIAAVKVDGTSITGFRTVYITGQEFVDFIKTFFELVLDTTPQLGGNLDVNGFLITSADDQDVIISPDGTGIVKIESDLWIRDGVGTTTAKALRFFEAYSNGSNSISLRAPNSLTNDTVYILPADGSIGQVLTTNGSGTLSWQTIASTDTNIYNTNGTLTGNRTLTGSNFELVFQTLGIFQVESHANGTDNVIFEVRSDPTFHGFIVRDHNTSVHMLACRNGAVEISDTYFLPTNAGTNGQVLTTDGAGNTSWQTPTGGSTPFIPDISGFNVSRYHIFTNGSTTNFYSGFLSGSAGGTQSALLLSGATATRIIRTRFTSGTASGSIAGYRGNGTDIFIGSGFHAIFTFGFADTTFNSSAHNWVGFGASITFQIGSITYASGLGNIIGVGNDPADTTLQIMHNDSTGAATKIPLSSNFPANRTAGTAFTGMFCLELYNDFGSSQVKWRMTRIDLGVVETGTITTNLPTTSTGLSPVVSRCNGSSSSIAAIMDVASIQCYTKY